MSVLLLFSENNTLKLSDTLKSKFKDIVQLHKDVSPTNSLNSSPKVEKKHKYIDDSFANNNNESKHENESPPSKLLRIYN